MGTTNPFRKLDNETKNKFYQEKTKNASTYERLGNYKKASDFWKEAERYALNSTEQNWCNYRHEFCKKMANQKTL